MGQNVPTKVRYLLYGNPISGAAQGIFNIY